MIRARVAETAAAAGLDCKADPHDVGVLRLWADIPEEDCAHERRKPDARCSLCDAPKRPRNVGDGFCPAKPTQRLVGLIVIRDEAVTYAEVGRTRFGSLGRSSIVTLDVVHAIEELTK
jgi:hypothetical protein